jgi:hypothetical protein
MISHKGTKTQRKATLVSSCLGGKKGEEYGKSENQ